MLGVGTDRQSSSLYEYWTFPMPTVFRKFQNVGYWKKFHSFFDIIVCTHTLANNWIEWIVFGRLWCVDDAYECEIQINGVHTNSNWKANVAENIVPRSISKNKTLEVTDCSSLKSLESKRINRFVIVFRRWGCTDEIPWILFTGNVCG